MVFETPTVNQMSGAKKLSLRKSMKLPFSRKSSSKKSSNSTLSENSDVGDGVVISPIPENYAGECQDQEKNSNGTELDGKTSPTTAKLPSGKSHKWLFKNKRSDSNRDEKRGPKISADLKFVEDQDRECVEPGSNSHEKYKDSTAGTSGDDLREEPVEGDHSKYPSTYNDSQNKFGGKAASYVIPLRREELRKSHERFLEMKQKSISDTNNIISNGSATDDVFNGNNQCPEQEVDNDAHIVVNETEDNFQQNLNDGYFLPPPPLFASPPQIPPKPASLRIRPLPTLAQGGCAGNNGEPDNCELPPRPPARPKNRSLGKVAVRPWQHSGSVVCVDNRATVYEIISAVPSECSLADELAKLPRQPWYWGPLTQAQAEEKLATLPDGNFLVRDSSDERYLLSLSFNSHGRTLHTRIEHRNGLFSLNDSDGHTSIVELIECAVKESRSGVYGYMRDALGVQSFPARLTDWVSRFTEMRSLQHLCRFLIREVYPRHHIQMLPLPKKIKEYILENQY